MKILKIDHLGIAVKSIDEGKNFWTDTLGLQFEGSETVAEQKVTTAFFPVGESEVELLESTAPDGPIAKYLEKKGEGLQHVAFRVENIMVCWLSSAKEIKFRLSPFADCSKSIRRQVSGFRCQKTDDRRQKGCFHFKILPSIFCHLTSVL
jgi:methylmalonyl-CoA/ethylmalonyl-CoA epimerase